MIAVIGKNRELGKDNKLLWNIPEDMKRFRKLTKGHVVIMGRKTFESIGRLLSHRMNIIITRDSVFKIKDAIITNSVEKAIKIARQKEINGEVFIIGGGQIYKQAMKYADKLYLTIVEGSFDADTFFPDYSEFKKVANKQEYKNGRYRFTFLDLER